MPQVTTKPSIVPAAGTPPKEIAVCVPAPSPDWAGVGEPSVSPPSIPNDPRKVLRKGKIRRQPVSR